MLKRNGMKWITD